MDKEVKVKEIQKSIDNMETQRNKAISDGLSVTAELLSGKIRKVKRQQWEIQNG